jgi:hypothetical protein
MILNQIDGQEGRIKGLRLGYDLSRLALQLGYDHPDIALPFLDTTRTAFELSADFEVKPYYYAVAEYGQQQVHFINDFYNYSSDGYYFRIGFDYNFLGEKLRVDQYEMIFGGIRYGFASCNHHALDVYIPDNYWGDVSIGELAPVRVNAHWFELAGGIRGELFKNVFIGWSFRARLMIYCQSDEVMYPYYIPGFGSGNRKTAIGFTYYVYYKIPFYKVKAKQ